MRYLHGTVGNRASITNMPSPPTQRNIRDQPIIVNSITNMPNMPSPPPPRNITSTIRDQPIIVNCGLAARNVVSESQELPSPRIDINVLQEASSHFEEGNRSLTSSSSISTNSIRSRPYTTPTTTKLLKRKKIGGEKMICPFIMLLDQVK